MIKLSWMTRASSGDPAEFDQAVDFARELDLDVIDFHLGGFPRDIDFLRRLKMNCLKNGLPIGFLGSVSIAGPREGMGERLDAAKADVDLAAFLGAPLIRIFARYQWPETEEEQEALWGPTVESFQELSDYAAEKGVAIGLQNHDHGGLGNIATRCLKLIEEADRDNLTFILDTGQWLGSVGGSPRGWTDITVDIYEDYIKPSAPHASCVRAKIYKIDKGYEEWLDYPRIFKILKDAGFNGSVCICLEGGDRNSVDERECLRLAARHLREVMTTA